MAAVTTTYLLELAAELAGWSEVPADCVVEEPGTRLSSLLAVLAAGPAEVFLARQLGYHAVISATSPLTSMAVAATMDRDLTTFNAAGLGGAYARGPFDARVGALWRAAAGAFSERAASVARLVEQPLVSIGPAVGELARRRLQARADETLAAETEATVQSLDLAFTLLPEFAGTFLTTVLGSPHNRVGRVWVLGELAEPGAEYIVRAYLEAGVDTLCVPWLSEGAVAHLHDWSLPGNVLLLGRAATLRTGLAPYLARLRAEGIEVRSLTEVEGTDGSAPTV